MSMVIEKKSDAAESRDREHDAMQRYPYEVPPYRRDRERGSGTAVRKDSVFLRVSVICIDENGGKNPRIVAKNLRVRRRVYLFYFFFQLEVLSAKSSKLITNVNVSEAQVATSQQTLT